MIVRTDLRCSGELTNAFVAWEELANLVPRFDNLFFSLATVTNIACAGYGIACSAASTRPLLSIFARPLELTARPLAVFDPKKSYRDHMRSCMRFC
jgi:hypothetical protein